MSNHIDPKIQEIMEKNERGLRGFGRIGEKDEGGNKVNLVDAYVTKVISSQEMDFGNGPLISVQVEYESYGVLSETSLVFFGKDRKKKAASVSKGYHFLA